MSAHRRTDGNASKTVYPPVSLRSLGGFNECLLKFSSLDLFISLRPHRMHVHMRPIATDVARSVVCVLDTPVSCAKTAELTDMLFGVYTRVGPRNYLLHGVKISTGRGTFGRRVRMNAYNRLPRVLRIVSHS